MSPDSAGKRLVKTRIQPAALFRRFVQKIVNCQILSITVKIWHMFKSYKPEWLYEALPYLYVLAGLATIANLGNTLSLFSGGLLISAGAFIGWMRRSARQEQRRKADDRRAVNRKSAERRNAERRRS